MARPRQPIPRYIDPSFEIPEGLIDLAYEPLDDVSDEDLAETEDEEPDDLEFLETQDEPEDEPSVPEEFTVISQTARFAPDGTRVVDVVIEVEDVVGITKYDVRKTKTA